MRVETHHGQILHPPPLHPGHRLLPLQMVRVTVPRLADLEPGRPAQAAVVHDGRRDADITTLPEYGFLLSP